MLCKFCHNSYCIFVLMAPWHGQALRLLRPEEAVHKPLDLQVVPGILPSQSTVVLVLIWADFAA